MRSIIRVIVQRRVNLDEMVTEVILSPSESPVMTLTFHALRSDGRPLSSSRLTPTMIKLIMFVSLLLLRCRRSRLTAEEKHMVTVFADHVGTGFAEITRS